MSNRSINHGSATKAVSLTLPGDGLTFSFQRDGCHSIRIVIRPDTTIQVKAPKRAPISTVFEFVHSRLEWIRARLNFFETHQGTEPEFRQNSPVWYLGRPFLLTPVRAGKNIFPCLTRNRLELPCRQGYDEHGELERVFLSWRLKLARTVLTRRLARLTILAQNKLNDKKTPSSLSVRSFKRRWGSCSIHGDIILAVQLIALPLPLIDHVIFHELCHLRRMDHGPIFHSLLNILSPNNQERKKELYIWNLEHPQR